MKPELKLVEDTGSQLEPDGFEFDPPPQQQEMPFAVVDGEPVTQLPRDLYIPPDALQVFLEAFEGPLDLLLYLIRRQNLDILDIPIAEITRQYMKYIDVMSELQLELAGEYLLMAAMLAEIKSRMLLPRPPSVEGSDEEDPRAELVRRLQEYERFKQAAEDIDRLPRMERDTMPTSAELTERKVVKIVPQVTLQEMLMALKDVMSRAEMFAHHHVHRDRLSVRQRMSDILSSLRESAFVDFTRLFRPEEGRMGVTVTFSAILELMKEGLIEIVQAEPYAPLHVRPASGSRHLKVVSDNDATEALAEADAENEAALAQPALPDENVVEDEEVDDLLAEEDPAATDSAAVGDEVAAADVENEAALAQPALPDEDVLDDEDFEEALDEDASEGDADVENLEALAQPELPEEDSAVTEEAAVEDSSTTETEAASEPIIDDPGVDDAGSPETDSVTEAPVDDENRERDDATEQK
ncbi:segregation and condensation protein A [Povalibacter uvarum]|uniref:Segregation and condensation protein A n=1 Tax=Povalibacter uvarum TaxID=732238 RepID=A0A841HGM3_9GAMM|nr:segregation and condensation protein A [Povalibacter uvarum]